MTTATTAAQPRPRPPGRNASKGGPLCWKLTASGQWITVTAPWERGKAEQWLCDNTGRLVFSSRQNRDLDRQQPAVEVFERRGADPSDAATSFVGCFEGTTGDEAPKPVDVIFLVDAPAIPRLLAEWAPFSVSPDQ